MAATPLSVGDNYAILSLDWMSVLLNAIEQTVEGQALIKNYPKWNDAVHQKSPRPLTIFTTLSFQHGQPEVQPNTPFARLIELFGTFETGSPGVQIDPQFQLDGQDLVLSKTRWSATSGNTLVQILKARGVDTVVITGLTLSGVIMSTIYRLFDLDFNVYVIKDNAIELPVDQTEKVSQVMLDVLLPKMGLSVISLDEALKMLERS
ncbi:cysteine hydrolase family protein [Aspergillus ellipticus CBS 707.79]|uniref:Cysteine hydrolase family protein n=1 Tax=Aspergillus ellipticus CBS 707.79 TaxID=1448320 RepID=A0A319DEI6_9EURO|nr:cysteine hydrolase family protein [Aspergillus ellipticus CBS 707.79]